MTWNHPLTAARTMVAAAAIAALVACADDGTGPQSTFDGVKYTASVNVIQSGNSLAQFAVIVTLENTTTTTKTRQYPAGCPVRVRLYRNIDGRLMYDETKRTCPTTTPATLTLTSRSTLTLTSGPRLPGSVLGDSLPTGEYLVRAVVMTEGVSGVEIFAGSYVLGSGPSS